mmetsp:Transcript_37043/g.55167  ORF Transcript_37043/g.55167 Transcript_37043/m.55167 type:complete len:99 (-) Transcript_37043:99-395(-)
MRKSGKTGKLRTTLSFGTSESRYDLSKSRRELEMETNAASDERCSVVLIREIVRESRSRESERNTQVSFPVFASFEFVPMLCSGYGTRGERERERTRR